MIKLQFNKRNPSHILYAIIIFIVVAFLVFNFQGCKRGTALRHYKKVAAETQLPLTDEKKNALATICGREFPNQAKIERKDSIVTKYVKVVDNALVNKLKQQIALLKQSNPKIDLDSLYENMLDSVLNSIKPCEETIHYKTETKTVIDTLGNYFKALEYKKQVDTANEYKMKYIVAEGQYKVALENEDKWRKRFFILLGICLVSVAGYVAYKIKKMTSITPYI